MTWLLWLILILLVIGALWWFFHRNPSTQSGSSTDGLHSANTAPPPGWDKPPLDEPVGLPSFTDDGSQSADTPAAADLHSATTAGKFGAGSADPGPDGSGPAGWTIKANQDSMKYHTEDSPWYARTVAEIWFDSEDRAAAAGFKRWDDRN